MKRPQIAHFENLPFATPTPASGDDPASNPLSR
jgi:hypothetical protein